MKLNYKLYGGGDPVIILHGLFGMGDNWRTIARMMEDQFTSIVVDMRNHGRSPHDPEMNFRVMVEDILELMDDLGYAEASLLGHSMGGKAAMQFAQTHGDRLDKLIVVDMAPKRYPPHHNAVINAIQSTHLNMMKDRIEVESSLAQFLGDDQSTIQFLMKNISRDTEGGFEWKSNMPVIIAAYDQLMDDIPVHTPFEGPAIFIRGEKSDYVRDEDLDHIHQLFPAAMLITIPNAGHWVHADNPAAISREVISFLQG